MSSIRPPNTRLYTPPSVEDARETVRNIQNDLAALIRLVREFHTGDADLPARLVDSEAWQGAMVRAEKEMMFQLLAYTDACDELDAVCMSAPLGDPDDA